MRRAVTLILLLGGITLTIGISWQAGFQTGKRAADRYYAEHPVTIIPPISWRAPEPASTMSRGSILTMRGSTSGIACPADWHVIPEKDRHVPEGQHDYHYFCAPPVASIEELK